MKLSYIVSVIMSFLIFSLLYLGLKFGIGFSLLISVISYFALTMIFKSKNELQEEVNNPFKEYEKLTNEASSNIKEINKYVHLIQNKKITDNISVICELSNKIIKTVKDNPKKINQIRKFINYYLPFTLNILKQYDNIENLKLTSSKSKKFMDKVEVMMDRVKDACQEQLNSLYDGDMLNTSADIKVFEDMLKSDGLVDDNMQVMLKKR